jgi:chromosome segregation ATPase
VAQEVRDSLTALVADESAEASVLTGALVRALSYSGFGSVDIDDVVAVDGGLVGGTARSRPSLEVLQGGGEGGEADAAVDLEERRRARRAAERSRLTTELEQARAELRTADRQVAVLTARQEEVVEGIADLERRLVTARARLEKVTSELDEANGIRDRAEQREATAAKALADDESP